MFRVKAWSKRVAAMVLSAAVFLGAVPAGGTAFPGSVHAEESGEETQADDVEIRYELIDIYTAEDLLAFADSCYVDSWSKNKAVTLQADIDLSGLEDFSAIPVFGGIFDGNGHTISGFNRTDAGYVTGLFRYIESTGIVKNLTLKGGIESDEECIGGLCAVNYGTIRSCTFRGTVKGFDTVGGIAGINESSGVISYCTVDGRVLGSYSTGGVAGINHGRIVGCTNRAGINDNTEWVEEDDELGVGIFLSLTLTDDDAEIYSGVDAGGIAGYSDGVITVCTNTGTVGYGHTGYNVGGIAGRQAGMVLRCTNKGCVYGRKDVGGIVGQMEPYIEVDGTQSLRSAINKLHDLIDKTIDDADAAKDVLKTDTDALLSYADGAVDAGDELASQIADFVDTNIGEVNEIEDRVSYVLSMLPGIMDYMDAAIDECGDVGSKISALVDELGESFSSASEETGAALSDAADSAASFADDISRLSEEVKELEKLLANIGADGDDSNNDEQSENGKKCTDDTITAVATTDSAAENEAVNKAETAGPNLYGNSGDENIVNDDANYSDGWNSLTDDEKKKLYDQLSAISEKLSDALASGSDSFSDISSLAETISDWDVSGTAQNAKANADAAADSLQAAMNNLKAASNRSRDIVNWLNEQPEITFATLGEDFDAARENLHSQLKGVSDGLSDLTDDTAEYSSIVSDDLRAVNDQLNIVLNLLADTLIDIGNLELEEYYDTDIDDETLAALTTGRAEACTNEGIVNGDINVGGIAGSMSIDSEDLEGNAAGSVDYEPGSSFIVQCAITNSVNEGYITAEKNGAGGIAGYMGLGVVADCEGYGSVESTDGSYVGGIAGESHTIIRRCYALCSVSGAENVGGIAGYAETLENCYAMTDVTAGVRQGAIAGQIGSYDELADDGARDKKVFGNYYVNDEIYGIDNVSYTDIAEPITYEELLAVPDLPAQFWHLQVIYKIEDVYLGSEEVDYGAQLNALNYPEIPEKEGYYGVWEDVSDKIMKGTLVVEAQYRRNVTVLQSGGDEALGGAYVKPYALVSESFTEDAELDVELVSGVELPERAERRESVVYGVSLENSGLSESDSFAVRLLNPYDDASVWAYRNGAWTRLDGKVRGQYIQVEMLGTSEMFCLIDEGSAFALYCIAFGGCCAAVLILAFALKKRKKSKTGKKKEKGLP